ncbi:hypothetical protein J3R83DRAFT_4560 [Lanmaoa asiatica]|nr:hypothetical protein J3R83DRAFT_4560 [Lanmaoa asiatica]
MQLSPIPLVLAAAVAAIAALVRPHVWSSVFHQASEPLGVLIKLTPEVTGTRKDVSHDLITCCIILLAWAVDRVRPLANQEITSARL